MSLAGEWAWLEEEAVPPDTITTRDTGVTTDHGSVLVGIDPGGARHLLLPAGDSGQVPEDRRSASVVLVPQPLEVDGVLTEFADLVCVEPTQGAVYTRLVEDVLQQVDSRSTEDEPPSWIAYRVLNEWRDLFARGRTLGRSKTIGLTGELTVIRRAYEDHGVLLLDSWGGPGGGRHDFGGESAALEVKATTAREGRRVEIHGVEQLAPDGERSLHLVYVGLSETPAGSTLFERVEDLLEMGIPRRHLLELLEAGGYQHRETPEAPRLRVSEVRWYEVDGDFPAVTPGLFPGGLPPGVERLRYDVDLDVAGPPLESSAVQQVVEALS